MKLYELSEKYFELLQQCDEDNPEIADALNSIELDIYEKVQNGIGLIQSLKRRADSYDAEIKRLVALKKATENNLARVQQYYLENLRLLGLKKVATSIGSMTVVNSGGKLPVIVDDENLVPAEYKFARYVIDKEKKMW